MTLYADKCTPRPFVLIACRDINALCTRYYTRRAVVGLCEIHEKCPSGLSHTTARRVHYLTYNIEPETNPEVEQCTHLDFPT